jgi:hypothetical protein
MFGQMRSRTKYKPLPPCPCGGSCRCHIPGPKWTSIEYILGAIWVASLIGFISILVFWPKAEPQHIQVDGKDCIVKHITDNCTSTGACRGHDIAICPQ